MSMPSLLLSGLLSDNSGPRQGDARRSRSDAKGVVGHRDDLTIEFVAKA